MKTFSSLIRSALALGVLALPAMAAAQAPSPSFSLYGEVVSFDAASKAATLRVMAQPTVAPNVGDLKAGDKVVLVWQPISNEADHVVYIGRESAMTAVDLGYILHAEFVSVDKAANTVTVKAAMPESAAATLQGAAGKWVKAALPRDQSGNRTVATSVALAAKPDLKPPPEVTKPKTAAANAAGPLANFGGTWEFEASLAGNAIVNTCTVTQDGTKLSGDCKSALGTAPLKEGEAAGNTLKFKIGVNFGGMPLEFEYSGVVEPDGKSINGAVSVFGMATSFTGVKR